MKFRGKLQMLYPILGIAILLIFYGCYFLKMIAQGRRGIRTDQMGRGKSGAVLRIERTMKVATYLTPAAEAASILCGATALPDGWRILGACLGIAGVAAFVASVVTMRDSWRAGVAEADETELVTRGIYQISRNPAFLGFDLVYAGILLMFFNWPLFALSLFAGAMLHLQIVKVEEAFLASAFGAEYERYKKKVCRYIGRK